MARLSEPLDASHGQLAIEQHSATYVDVFFIPSEGQLRDAGLDDLESDVEHRVKILEIDSLEQRLTIMPIFTYGDEEQFLRARHRQVKRITLSCDALILYPSNTQSNSEAIECFLSPCYGLSNSIKIDETTPKSLALVPSTPTEVMAVLEALPSTFVKDYDWGLGFRKLYRPIVDAIEKLTDCTEIVITDKQLTGIDDDTSRFYVKADDFDWLRRKLNSVTDLGQKAVSTVKSGSVYNFLAKRIGQPNIPISVGKHSLRRFITAAAQGENAMTEEMQNTILDFIGKEVGTLAITQPRKLSKIRDDIELATLEQLISNFETMLNKDCSESLWQAFLQENPFLLQLAFGYPIAIVQDQAYVGGQKTTGKGANFTDFLIKNRMTNNAAIIEIKRPKTGLILNRRYRSSVYPPSTQLVGAISQLLEQRYKFDRSIAQCKENSRITDLETYSVHCCLIIGRVPGDIEKQKSFEHFRRNSKTVDILTFDELLLKLKEFFRFLKPKEEEVAVPVVLDDSDLPF